MIAANDLRIGDYIKNQTGWFKVRGVGNGSVWVTDYPMSSTFYEPILLSPEILENSNAIKDNYGLFYFRKDGIKKSESGMDISLTIKQCLINGEYVWDCCVGNFKNSIHLCYIKYLHEIQNLIFAITKKELQVKL